MSASEYGIVGTAVQFKVIPDDRIVRIIEVGKNLAVLPPDTINDVTVRILSE